MFSDICTRICILSSAFLLIQATELPLGVHPTNAPFYVPNKPFTCLDKSSTIPWNKVNDDYCDCLDGSDEPGTSACPDMKFYCVNFGHEGVFIHSGYVNDMVCDCCDGSDEYSGRVKCNNTCGTLAKEKEELIEKRRRDFESGHKIYKEYVTKKAVELEEEAKRKTEEEERRKTEQEDIAKQSSGELDVEPETSPTPEPATQPHLDESSENQGFNDEKSENEAAEIDHIDDSEDQPSDFSEVPDEYSPHQIEEPPVDYGPDNGFMMLTEPETGCLEFEDKEYVYSLCAFREVRQRNRDAPKGTGILLGRWKEWVGHPGGSVNWSREEKLAKLSYNEMFYGDGESCWNGPSRSVKVKVSCGAINRLLSAEEPSRCVYEVKLETPAACYHDPAQLMRMHTEL